MGFRFQKRVKILPGLTLNLSKGGVSVSTGVRGARASIGTKGVRGTLGLPGTGLSYSKTKSWNKMGGKSNSRSGGKASRAAASDQQKLDVGFFRRFLLSGAEKHLIDGLTAILEENLEKAVGELEQARNIPDAAFTLACLRLKNGEYEAAKAAFGECEGKIKELGQFYRKYDLALMLDLEVTEYAGVEVVPGEYALRLGQVECLQGQEKTEEALGMLREMLKKYPGDMTVMLSVAELVTLSFQEKRELQEWLLAQLTSVTNDSNLHANLLLYKAQAQAELGLFEAAAATLTSALRKTAERDPELLLSMRCQRALYWRELGKDEQFAKELAIIKGERPDIEL